MARVQIAATLALCVAAVAAPTGAPSARADTLPALTTEQSTSLGRALRLWTTGLVGGDPASPGFTLTPADGHYDIAIPVAGKPGDGTTEIEGDPITAQASLGDDGRWHFDAIKLPSPLRLTGHGTTGADKTSPPLRIVEEIAGQTSSAVVDPTLAGNSTGETALTGLRQRVDDGLEPLTITVEKVAYRTEWVPSSAGRVDSGSVTKLDVFALHPDNAPGNGVKIRTATVTSQLTDADPAHFADALRKGVAFLSGLTLSDDKPDLTDAQRAEAHELVALARDLVRGAKSSISAQGISFTSGGQTATLDKLDLTQTFAAPDGKLDTRMRLELAGLSLPFLPPGAARDLLPRHVVFAPFAAGTTVDDLAGMADKAIDDRDRDPAALAGEAQARMAHSPVTSGVEELSFDLGPAKFAAKGQVVTSGPADIDGDAVIEATGLDALIKKVSADRMLKQGVAALVFLKGIGNQDGEKTVWNVAYKGGKVSVNGTDMSDMIPGK